VNLHINTLPFTTLTESANMTSDEDTQDSNALLGTKQSGSRGPEHPAYDSLPHSHEQRHDPRDGAYDTEIDTEPADILLSSGTGSDAAGAHEVDDLDNWHRYLMLANQPGRPTGQHR